MKKNSWLLLGLLLGLAFLLPPQGSAQTADGVSEVLRRQTQELIDAVTAGSASVWDQAEVADVLFVPGKPRYRKVFLRGSDGRITGFAERREAWDLKWTRMPPIDPVTGR